jgi:two-component sensor histidine kinase
MRSDELSRGSHLCDAPQLLDGLRMGGVGVWRWLIDTDILNWTDNLEGVHALPEGSFDGTLSSFRNDVHPDDMAHVWAQITAAIRDGGHYRAVYRTNPAGGAEPIWIEARGGVLQGQDGQRYLTGVCLDVSEQVCKSRELERRLRQQKAIEEVGSFALGESDFLRIMERAVEVAAQILDVPMAKILQFTDSADHLVLVAGVGWKDGLVGHAQVGIERASQAGYTLIADAPVVVDDLRTETRFDGPPLLHEHGVVSGMSLVIPGSDKRPFGVFGIHTRQRRSFDKADLDFFVALSNIVANSARHHAAAAQRNLLLREMAHRAGNMLQLVSTIANQTFSPGRDIAEAKHAFAERLGSLSRANYLVSRGGWTSTRLQPLVEEVLNAFGSRIDFSGRDVMLAPELCFDLGLVMHELATNSAKYGTLGMSTGTVRLNWSLGPRDEEGVRAFTLVWDDAVSNERPSERQGFGSRLIEALMTRKWSGTVRRAEAPGYRLDIEIPIKD